MAPKFGFYEIPQWHGKISELIWIGGGGALPGRPIPGSMVFFPGRLKHMAYLFGGKDERILLSHTLILVNPGRSASG